MNGLPITALFEHNLWANLQLFDACAQLEAAQLEAANPGAYGTIRATLRHLAGAEQRYLSIFTGKTVTEPLERQEALTIAELRQHIESSSRAFIEIATNAKADETVESTYQGKPWTLPVNIVLIQVINHATEHRTNITTILSGQNVDAPQLDGWTYLRATAA